MHWIGAILAIGLLIVVHEAGHYFVARWCKMRVERFSIGFGPAIWSRKRGDTTFQIAPVPFGGYVQISGMLVHDEVDENDPTAYPNRPAWQRFLTIFAGPGTNYLFAIALAIVLYAVAGVPTGTSWYTVQEVKEGYTAAQQLKPGDRILRIKHVRDEALYSGALGPEPIGIEQVVADSGGRPLTFQVDRGGKTIDVDVTPTRSGDAWTVPARFGRDPAGEIMGATRWWRVGAAESGSPLVAGDRILGVRRVLYDDPLYHRYEGVEQKALSDYVQEARGGTIWLTVERDGAELAPIAVTPQPDHSEKLADGSPAYRIGIGLNFKRERRDEGILASLGHALWYPVAQTKVIIGGLYKVVRGEEKGELAGPVGITTVIKESIAAGWITVIELLMILNVYLGLFNLFPLPALDGGRLVFLGYEMATRRRANPKIEATVHMVGIMALLVLMVLVTYKDIARLL
jgi:regulator of sigma E protease